MDQPTHSDLSQVDSIVCSIREYTKKINLSSEGIGKHEVRRGSLSGRNFGREGKRSLGDEVGSQRRNVGVEFDCS